MSEFLAPFEHMLEQIVTPAAVRAIESSGDGSAMWGAIAESGFLDALVPEERGGAGLPLTEVQPLWMALGRRAVPLPVGETMIARGLCGDAPAGPIALATARAGQEVVVPSGRIAAYLLIDGGDGLHLVDTASIATTPTGVVGDLSARMRWDSLPSGGRAPPVGGLRSSAAVLRASLIAGAAERLTEMTAAYAGERLQFGKPIGRQQALQQQMAVMAEETVAARLASQLGAASGFPPRPEAAATAKSVASRAAARVAATAHAVHGAIGISAEYDLQLLTRRLHEWRLADGGEAYWNRQLGAARLASEVRSVDYVRTAIFAETR
ncbi:MAG: acyl-CoA dehydrogenase family protein [Sphingopyxis sp.]|uniref:acyl-CoA dehydrogenase family protein n=1 Tax=Sphingopyxis sp. TaxID=1908224 RepID=UPI002ABA1C04|nr:acyl-CoA dehydrogenase family protein [Sphingopyxis sp.]MDZ3832374.1 acyl-CoA dehydrogenase family protein [Sphingopyxis sp.]